MNLEGTTNGRTPALADDPQPIAHLESADNIINQVGAD